VPRDDAEAVRWYRKAAEQGFAWGQTNLGYMYGQGRGIARDDAEAVQWYLKAAKQGFAMAQDNLGVVYRDGRGVTQDPAMAVDWFRKAAEQGFAQGQNNLGFMYSIGRGVARDEAEAVQWYRKAAQQGLALAQDNLGVMYRDGRGIFKDDAQAVQWFRKAAEQGNARAQTNLGIMYRDGRGIAKDDAEAEQWLRKAAEQGDTRAQTLLSSTTRRPTKVSGSDPEFPRDAVHAGIENGHVLLSSTISSTTRRPTKVSGSDPEFPRDAIQAGIENGHVLAQVLIDETGNVYEVTIVKADPPGHFEQAVIEALSQWKFLGDGTKYKADIETKFELKDGPARSPDDLTNTIAALVKKYEAAQPVPPVPDAERAAVAHEIVDATGIRESLALQYSPERMREDMAASPTQSRLSPQLRDALRVTLVASLRADRVLASLERGLAEKLDSATLQTGLEWERSDLGSKINRLKLEAERAELRAAKMEFVTQLVKKGGIPNDDPRARACAQKDVLDNSAESMLPFLEALAAAGGLVRSTQAGQSLDLDAIQRLVVAIRPTLRDTARQAVVADCMFSLPRLSDAEFDKWLEFLRTDLGGRYARA
jgi:TonB family protein